MSTPAWLIAIAACLLLFPAGAIAAEPDHEKLYTFQGEAYDGLGFVAGAGDVNADATPTSSRRRR